MQLGKVVTRILPSLTDLGRAVNQHTSLKPLSRLSFAKSREVRTAVAHNLAARLPNGFSSTDMEILDAFDVTVVGQAITDASSVDLSTLARLSDRFTRLERNQHTKVREALAYFLSVRLNGWLSEPDFNILITIDATVVEAAITRARETDKRPLFDFIHETFGDVEFIEEHNPSLAQVINKLTIEAYVSLYKEMNREALLLPSMYSSIIDRIAAVSDTPVRILLILLKDETLKANESKSSPSVRIRAAENLRDRLTTLDEPIRIKIEWELEEAGFIAHKEPNALKGSYPDLR
ncbi:MAG: hypothetical protein WCV91_04165 [Candidatus Margulisiibacteriota bacterium]